MPDEPTPASPFGSGRWNSEPRSWRAEGRTLMAVAAARTDFWRTTHYGFIRDDGHVHGLPVPGDFSMTTSFTGDYRVLYDQAGLMLRCGERSWLKAGVEYVDEIAWLSSVVTRETSDWALASPLPRDEPVWLRMRRVGTAVHVEHAPDGKDWRLVRLSFFPPSPDDVAGPMLACPQAESFTARFSDFSLET
jgi:regulation of enolase protein 1 (concanavalin A-like superfamily)